MLEGKKGFIFPFACYEVADGLRAYCVELSDRYLKAVTEYGLTGSYKNDFNNKALEVLMLHAMIEINKANFEESNDD